MIPQDSLLARAVAEDEAYNGPVTLIFRVDADPEGDGNFGVFDTPDPVHPELIFPGSLLPLSLAEQRKSLDAKRDSGGAALIGGYELHIRHGAACLTPGKTHLKYGEDATEFSVTPEPLVLQMDDLVRADVMAFTGKVKGIENNARTDGVYAYNVLAG